MELLFLVIILALFGVIAYGFIWKARRNREVVSCVNCGNRMTYRRFSEHGGCLQCGSDLYDKVGQ